MIQNFDSKAEWNAFVSEQEELLKDALSKLEQVKENLENNRGAGETVGNLEIAIPYVSNAIANCFLINRFNDEW